MVEWNEETLQRAVQELRKSTTVKEACNRLGEFLNEEVSTNALRKAFQRNDLESPSHYLICNRWKIKWESKTYDVQFQNSTLPPMSFELIEKIVLLYVKHHPGQGMTAREVAEYLYLEDDIDYITEELVTWLMRSFRISKDMFPCPPHKFGDTDEEVIQYMTRRADAFLKEKYREVNSVKSLVNENRQLKDEINELTQIIGTTESLVDKQVSQLVYPEIDGGKNYLVVFLADPHAGKKVEKNSLTAMQNEFNQDVFKQRGELICSIIQRESKWLKDIVDGVMFVNLGDNLEALFENMRSKQYMEMYGDPFSNYMDVIDLNYNIINCLNKEFEMPVDAVKIAGNHDRISHEKNHHDEWVITQIIAERVAREFKDNDEVDVKVGAPVTSILLPNRTNLICQHGNLKEIKAEEKYWPNFVDIHGHPEAIRYLTAQGHFHRSAMKWFRKGVHVDVPPYVGTDYFATDHLHKANEAGFLMMLTNRFEERPVGPFSLQR